MRMEPGWFPYRRKPGKPLASAVRPGNLTNPPRKARLRGMAKVTKFPAQAYWTKAKIAEARDRAEMAESVTLPIDQFLDLLDMAERDGKGKP